MLNGVFVLALEFSGTQDALGGGDDCVAKHFQGRAARSTKLQGRPRDEVVVVLARFCT